jgi:DNA polymerase I-like protein with 3'-5' exonuclease and polymerase domains
VNFATIYGQGATALGQILGIPRKDAVRYIDQYFEHYQACGSGSIARSRRRTRGAT